MCNGTDGQLRLLFQDLAQEIQILKEITAPFVDTRSAQVLGDMGNALEGLWSACPDRERRWEMGDLWTTVSAGEYEGRGRKGGKSVVACISGTWDVKPLGPNAKKEKEKRKRLLEFVGIASTRVRLYYAEDLSTPISMWRMELGDASAPGCFFHVQILGEEDTLPFPKAVPVPRLPTLFVTPMGVVEYVLGELFQDRWAQTTMEQGSNIQRWAGLQKKRFLKLFEWQRTTIEKSLSSPWVALKSAKPSPSMFIG
jgi:hypothetical protein